MSAQRLGRLIRPHNLTSLLIVLFALLVLASGLGAGAAQSPQDGAAAPASDEREFKNTVPAHVPIKVKLRNEQTFKKKENKNWARELEVEVKNTGTKPIYYLYIGILMPDVIVMGHPLSLGVVYGRKELAFFETPLEPGDVPILPGESFTLKFPESRVKAYEERREREKRPDPKKVEFYMQIINYGDGTGFEAVKGLPVSGRTRKRSRHAPPPGQPPGDNKPARKAGATGLPSKPRESLDASTPASFLRVNFSPPETASVVSPAAQITGGCNDCQTNTGGVCMWGTHGLTDCACPFPAVLPSNSCGDPSGRCLRVRTVTEDCPTEFNGTVSCQFQQFFDTCAVGDPTPTPTPTQTPTPDPSATPAAPQPNSTNCFPQDSPITGEPFWFCACQFGDDGKPADYPQHGQTGCKPNTFNNGRDCCICQFETFNCPPGSAWNRTECECLPIPSPPPPPPGGGSCTYATTENPWLDGQGCELCGDGADNDCNGFTDGQEPGCWNRCNSPVLVDTDGDGFSLTSAADGVLFDFNGDGRKERLSWTSRGADDAWLALDRDGDGRIGDARELFGNLTAQPQPPAGTGRNGFLALSEFDRAAQGGNGDGVIDGRDAVFTSLRLWRDANHDGTTESGELHALPSLGVARIYLDYKESKRVDAHGNRFRYRAKVDDAKGLKVNRWAWDVFLATAP